MSSPRQGNANRGSQVSTLARSGLEPSGPGDRGDYPLQLVKLKFWFIRRPVVHLILGVALAATVPLGVSSDTTEATAPGYPRITYTKTLKGSIPEYVSLTVDRHGNATYEGRKLSDHPSSRSFRLKAATTEKIFELAQTLNNFDGADLESHKKVADLGRKTLAYEDGSVRHVTEFNYSQRPEAQQLVDIFEKISAVAQHIATLEYAIQFDRLSLPEQLRQIQKDLDRRALADPELMEPMLRKIAENPRFLHLAQARAQNILRRVQGHD